MPRERSDSLLAGRSRRAGRPRRRRREGYGAFEQEGGGGKRRRTVRVQSGYTMACSLLTSFVVLLPIVVMLSALTDTVRVWVLDENCTQSDVDSVKIVTNSTDAVDATKSFCFFRPYTSLNSMPGTRDGIALSPRATWAESFCLVASNGEGMSRNSTKTFVYNQACYNATATESGEPVGLFCYVSKRASPCAVDTRNYLDAVFDANVQSTFVGSRLDAGTDLDQWVVEWTSTGAAEPINAIHVLDDHYAGLVQKVRKTFVCRVEVHMPRWFVDSDGIAAQSFRFTSIFAIVFFTVTRAVGVLWEFYEKRRAGGPRSKWGELFARVWGVAFASFLVVGAAGDGEDGDGDGDDTDEDEEEAAAAAEADALEAGRRRRQSSSPRSPSAPQHAGAAAAPPVAESGGKARLV